RTSPPAHDPPRPRAPERPIRSRPPSCAATWAPPVAPGFSPPAARSARPRSLSRPTGHTTPGTWPPRPGTWPHRPPRLRAADAVTRDGIGAKAVPRGLPPLATLPIFRIGPIRNGLATIRGAGGITGGEPGRAA